MAYRAAGSSSTISMLFIGRLLSRNVAGSRTRTALPPNLAPGKRCKINTQQQHFRLDDVAVLRLGNRGDKIGVNGCHPRARPRIARMEWRAEAFAGGYV